MLSFAAAVANGELFFQTHMENEKQLGKSKVKGGHFNDDGWKGKCFTGGGEGEKIIVPLKKPFSVEAGTVSLYFRVNPSAVLDKSIRLFDVLGSPRWWDRFTASVTPKKDGILRVAFSVCETKQGRYADRPTVCEVKLSPRSWHHLACTWENINSGRTDAVFKVYLDGVLLRETKSMGVKMMNPAKEIILAGLSEKTKPVEPNPSGCVSLDEVTVWPEALSPSAIHRLACVEAVTCDFEDVSRCPVYKLVGTAPTIDGVFHPEEWNATQTLGPFRNFRQTTGTLAEQQTRVNLAYDAKGKLYIGWQAFGTSNPSGESSKLDSALWKSDSLELFFSPDGNKIVHFIGNAYSSVYDEVSEDGGITWNRDWNGAWEYKSSTGDGLWSGELVFDPATLNLPPIKSGNSLIFNACRNHVIPQMDHSVWNKPSGNSFKNPTQMGRIRFYEKGLICNHIEVPEAVMGVDKIVMFLANPFWLKEIPQMELSVFSMGKNGQAKEGDISTVLFDAANASGKKTFAYSVTHEGLHKAILAIGDTAEKESAYSRPFYLDVKPLLQVEVTGNPCEGVLTAEIKAHRLKGKITGGRLTLLDGSGKAVLTQDVGPKRVQKIPFPIKDVTPGGYTLNMAFLTSRGKTVAERNVPLNIIPRPVCFSKDAGMKNYIKPWGPMSLEDQTVKCWNREYIFDKSLFPTKLISNGQDVLAGRPFFKYVTKDSQRGNLNVAQLKVLESTPEKVMFDVQAGDKRITAAGTITVEYDGLIIYNLALTPKKKLDIKSFRLVFPLSAKSAKYIIEGTAYGATREKNVISHSGFQSNFPFTYSIGVTSEDRGMFWFCESDEGWRPYDRNDVVNVSRKAKDVHLVFNIMRDVDFVEPLKLKFGFMGTPVKPMNFKLDRERIFQFYPGGPLKATDIKDCYQKFDLKKAAKLGVKVVCPHEWWWKYYGGMEVANEESFKRFVKEAHELGMKVLLYRNAMANPQEPSYRYFGDTWLRYPITGFTKYTGIARLGVDFGIVRCPNSPGYIDWYVGGCRELVRKYDIDGFYYDFGITPCVNPKHGCGYVPKDGSGTKSRKGDTTEIVGVDVLEDGTLYSNRRATYPVFSQRKLWQRMYNMLKEEKGEEGFINVHTDVFSPMVLSFVDTVRHSETAFCRQRTGDFPTPEMYRIFYSKEILGLPGEQIFKINRKRRAASDAPKMMSISLLHREWFRPGAHGFESKFDPKEYSLMVPIWRIFADFGVDDATWHPYWKHSPISVIQVSPWGETAVLCSYWQKPNGLLAIVSNVSEKPQDVEVTLSEPAANFKTITDTQSGEKQKADKTTTYHLMPREFKLLRIE